jgi:transposase
VREAIEARSAEFMLLPSYSHDLNPIEHAFAKLKELLRKAAPRTRES